MKSLALIQHPVCRWFVILVHLGLGGCVNREVASTFPTQSPPPFSAGGEADVPDRWWTSFDDSQLDAQVNRSLDGNFTLAAALQRLGAARALALREASDLWPDLDGVVEFEDFSASDGRDDTLFAFGLDASYQVDLWGQIESRVDALRLQAAATREDYHAVALTLSGEIARTWFSLVEAHAQLELLKQQIETNRKGLELQEASFGLGQVGSADVLRQRQLVQSTQVQAVAVQSRIEVLEHLLAVLQGRPPQEVGYQPGTQLPSLPPLPDTGLPSELLRRRPDVRRDFLAFRSANRELASAISAQYPRLSLTGSLTNVAERPEDLFREWFLSIGAQLIAPLFDGGQRRAEVHRTASVVRQRFNEYGQTVLGALREVEDALAQEKYQVERIELLNTQVELARQASLQLREAYLIGEADFLDRLSAVTEEQRLQREILSARLELVLIRVRLYLALAGSFDPRPEIRPEIAPPPALPAEQLPPPGQAEEERSPENVIDE